MKYKIIYKDCNGLKHARYYSALDIPTVKEMFHETVDHSIRDEHTIIVDIQKLDEEAHRWKPTDGIQQQPNLNNEQ
jgi:hypothetical protein